LVKGSQCQIIPGRNRYDASLANGFNTLLEGAFVMSKAVGEPGIIAQQLRHYKNYIELLFVRE